MNKTQIRIMWAGLAVMCLLTVFQPRRYERRYNRYKKESIPARWEMTPIFYELEESTVPFLVRTGVFVALLIVLTGSPARRRISRANAVVAVCGTSICYLATLMSFDGDLYLIFSNRYEIHANSIVLISVIAVITGATMLTMRYRE